jgi:uncharacterized membrane protein
MNKFKTILNYGLIGLNVLLAFCLIFESKLQVPTLLEPLGRMHPLFLHLPIGMFVGLILLLIFKKEFEGNTFDKVYTLLAGSTALFAVTTALFGLFLSNESGYSSDDLFWHKWTGVAFSAISYGLYLFPNLKNPTVKWAMLGSGLVSMMAAGHIGGEITHGENFIFEAFEKEIKTVVTDSSNIYTAKVFPILEQKCVQCHNDQKTKGELNMSSIAKLLAGGKNGKIWEPGNALNSHLIQRALLPLDDKEHMPPKSKPQLTDYEIKVLTDWINLGAETEKTIGDYKTNTAFYTLLMGGDKPSINPPKTYSFSGASESDIAAVNTPFCSVYPISYNSPALEAKFFVRQKFNREVLENLKKVENQIVSLNLAKMPLKDEDLTLITRFKNLESLNLNATDIKGQTLEELAKLRKLESLAISNTEISDGNIEKLVGLKNLKELYLWEVKLSEVVKEKLLSSNKQLTLFEGFDPDNEAPLMLNPPQFVDAKSVLQEGAKISLKHVLPDVTIRYTLDGTDPDSTTGLIYTDPIEINSYTKLKAIALKEGWYKSKTLENDFYKATYEAKNAKLLTEANKQYTANGAKTLIDSKKGAIDNFKDNNWLGYKDTPLVALFEFDEPKPLREITLSYLLAVDGYIMPPTQVQFYAGMTENNLKLVSTQKPAKLSKPESTKSLGINASIKDGNYKFVKIVATPINPLPAWHQGKGQRGWVFVDEVFFN